MVRNINNKGLDLIKSYEKCRLKAFKPIPTDPWTIGWGDTENVHEGLEITQEEADWRLKERIYRFCCDVDPLIIAPLTDNQFSAIISLVYNIGIEAFKNSTLLKKLNEFNFSGASDQFLVWNKSAGVVLNGLIRRRKEERRLFLT